VAVEQRRAASGWAAGGGLPYRPDEDVPLHELRGGMARASRVRREAGPGGLARGTRAQGAGRHADGLGAAPSSCSPRLLPRRDGELQTSAPGADSRPPAVLVLVSSCRTATHPPPATLRDPAWMEPSGASLSPIHCFRRLLLCILIPYISVYAVISG